MYADIPSNGWSSVFSRRIGVLAGAIVLTWLYNSSGGSVLAVVLWHASFNFVSASPTSPRGILYLLLSHAIDNIVSGSRAYATAWSISWALASTSGSLDAIRLPSSAAATVG